MASMSMHITGISVCSFHELRLRTTNDLTAKIWDTSSTWDKVTFKGPEAVWSVAVSPDERWLLTGNEDGTATLWDVATGRALAGFKGHSAPVWSVAFSPDGHRLMTGSGDGDAIVWDSNTSAQLLRLKGHNAGITSVAFSPDGQRVATGSADESARVWDAATGGGLLWPSADTPG